MNDFSCSAAFLVDTWLLLCMIESKLTFVDAATNGVYQQWFTEVFPNLSSDILFTIMSVLMQCCLRGRRSGAFNVTVYDRSSCSVLLQVCAASLRATWQSCCWLGAREPDWGSLTPKACTMSGCRPTKPSFRSRPNAYWSCNSWLSRSTKSSAVFPGKTSCYLGGDD